MKFPNSSWLEQLFLAHLKNNVCAINLPFQISAYIDEPEIEVPCRQFNPILLFSLSANSCTMATSKRKSCLIFVTLMGTDIGSKNNDTA